MILTLLVVAVVIVLAGSALDIDALDTDDPPATAAEAKASAYSWVGVGVAETPRRSGDEWEVDVIRPDGSLVEVTVGDQLELRELDEERGPGGGPAHDEGRGPVRQRAARAALAETGPGRVLSVERDTSREDEILEVNIRREDGVALEVGLDSSLAAIEVDRQEPGDE